MVIDCFSHDRNDVRREKPLTLLVCTALFLHVVIIIIVTTGGDRVSCRRSDVHARGRLSSETKRTKRYFVRRIDNVFVPVCVSVSGQL